MPLAALSERDRANPLGLSHQRVHFTVETIWLQRLYVLFFIEQGSRRVHIAECMANRARRG